MVFYFNANIVKFTKIDKYRIKFVQKISKIDGMDVKMIANRSVECQKVIFRLKRWTNDCFFAKKM